MSAAKSALLAAQQQFAADHARIDGTVIEDHPEVQAAASAVHSAFLTVARTQLPVPVSGYVAHRNVQLGQRVSPGAVLMDIVPLNQVWVDANFKELQIANLRMGQPATVTADLYGGAVKYHGTVVGFSAGTGAAFALLPAQNATGNWIKWWCSACRCASAWIPMTLLRIRCRWDCRCAWRSPPPIAMARACRSRPRPVRQSIPPVSSMTPTDRPRRGWVAIIAANLPVAEHGRVAHHLVQVPTRPAT